MKVKFSEVTIIHRSLEFHKCSLSEIYAVNANIVANSRELRGFALRLELKSVIIRMADFGNLEILSTQR